MPEIRLDHGETVFNNTVYSSKMLNPFTGTSFSEEAQRLLKQKRNRNDEITKNTNLFIDASLQRLADLQEWIKPDGEPFRYQFGTTHIGPLQPGLPPPNTQQMAQNRRFWRTSPAIHLPTNVMPTYVLPQVTITAPQTNLPTRTLPEVTITAKRTTKTSKPKTTAPAAEAQNPTTTRMALLTPLPSKPLPKAVKSVNAGPPSTNTLRALLTPSPKSTTQDTIPGATVGDWLQAATVASRFLNLLGGPAYHEPALDDTHIRENLVDDTQVINRIRRLTALRNRAATPNSRAITQAVANAAVASSIQAESDARARIAEINAARRSQTDLQRSAQRRYNAAVINQTRQYNQASRDAHRMALDNAFESLGYLGQALNDRQQAYEILNLYKKVYPHAFTS